jgi:hypothetical protein
MEMDVLVVMISVKGVSSAGGRVSRSDKHFTKA